MNVTAFAQKIKKDNRTDRDKCKCFFIIFLCSVFILTGYEDSTAFGAGDFAVILLIVLLYSVSFYRQYIRVTEKSADNKYLYNIVRAHAFNVKEYFLYIRKKQLVWQIAILAYIVAVGIIHKVAGTVHIDISFFAAGIAAAIIPSIVGVIIQKDFEYRISNRCRQGFGFLKIIIGGLLWLAEIILSFVIIFIVIFSVWAVISDSIAKDFNNSEIIYRTYSFTAVLTVMMIVAGLFIYVCVFYFEKKRVLLRIIFGALTIMLGIVEAILEQNNYVDIKMDEIIVVTFDGKTAYSFDEIEGYNICEEDEGIQVKMTFNDGNTVKLFSGLSTSTEAYDEIYYSEYNYVADLIRKFSEYEVEGSITDIDKLRDAVEGLDNELGDGLEEIIGFMESGNH